MVGFRYVGLTPTSQAADLHAVVAFKKISIGYSQTRSTREHPAENDPDSTWTNAMKKSDSAVIEQP
jgi:hypothetical protein